MAFAVHGTMVRRGGGVCCFFLSGDREGAAVDTQHGKEKKYGILRAVSHSAGPEHGRPSRCPSAGAEQWSGCAGGRAGSSPCFRRLSMAAMPWPAGPWCRQFGATSSPWTLDRFGCLGTSRQNEWTPFQFRGRTPALPGFDLKELLILAVATSNRRLAGGVTFCLFCRCPSPGVGLMAKYHLRPLPGTAV